MLETDKTNVSFRDIVSLDLETSTGTPDSGDILSIGAYHLASHAEFYREIKYKTLSSVSPESSRVHGLDLSRVDMLPFNLTEVDKQFRNWYLETTGKGKPWTGIALGWNVSNFDLAYIRPRMKQTSLCFSHRSVDMNAVCFFIDSLRGVNLGNTKKTVKKRAAETFPDFKAHNALDDAKMAALCYEYLVDKFGAMFNQYKSVSGSRWE